MTLIIACDCGEHDRFDDRDYRDRGTDAIVLAMDEWKREHLRAHEKTGDHDEHTFTTEVER